MTSTDTPSIRGLDVDAQGRCAHWHGQTDVVAIRLPCCDEHYACFACHELLAGHVARPWPRAEFDRTAVLCGVCGLEMTVAQYLTCGHRCPGCGAAFNPRCASHHALYFEIGAD